MKIKHLAAACALAFAGVAGQSHAFDTTLPTLQVYLSGASAPQQFFGAVLGQLFEPGFRTYFDSNNTAVTTDDGRNFRAFIGTLRNADPVPQAIRGQQAMILYRTQGGSVFGVNPVARAQAIASMSVTRTDPAKPGDGTVAGGGCTELTSGSFRCPIVGLDPGQPGYPTKAERVPDFGVSDVPPALFVGDLNNEFGALELTDAERAVLAVRPAVGIAMGPVASLTVPAAVNFSQALYSNLLSGAITDWSAVPDAGAGPVIVCRRTQGSGTQAIYNWYFNQYPCADRTLLGTNFSTPARMTDSWDDASVATQRAAGAGQTAGNPIVVSSGAGGWLVIENLTSGQVRDCLIAANNGGVHNFRWENGEHMRVNFGTARRAIGLLSLDSGGAAGEGVTWSFRTLNGAGTWITSPTPRGGTQTGTGIAPSVANMVNGSWGIVGELTFQFRNATVDGVPAPTAEQQALIDTIIRQVASPTVLNGTETNPANSFISLPTVADPATHPDSNRISNFSRVANMCQPPVFRPGVQ